MQREVMMMEGMTDGGGDAKRGDDDGGMIDGGDDAKRGDDDGGDD